MKICMVTIDNPLHQLNDGIAVSVNELSMALAGFGHDVWIIGVDKYIDREKIIEMNGVKYWCIPCNYSSVMAKMFYFMKNVPKRLEKLYKEEKIDIFHGHGGYAGPIILADLPKSRKILTVHTTSEEDTFILKDLFESRLYIDYLKKLLLPPLPMLKLYRKWYFNRMDLIISISNYNINAVTKDFRLSRNKFVVIPNGVNYDKFQKLKSKFNIEEKENTILYYGRLSPRKGLQVLLYSIPILLEEFPSLKVNIVGNGEYLPVLKKLVLRLNIREYVNFKGSLDNEMLTKEILESTIVVIPSLYEGLPLTLLESMGMGRPVVVSKLPGICEILDNGITGMVTNPGDSSSLAKGIKILLHDPIMRKRMGKRAEIFVRNNLTWNDIAKKMLNTYNSL